MRKLDEKELLNYNGGKSWIIFAGASIITFLIGVLDGYMRPLKCNS